MAKANNLVQNCITRIKHTLTKAEWFIRPVDPKADAKQYKDQIDYLTKLIKCPFPKHNDKDFFSMLCDDILVLDRGACEIIRNVKGDIVQLWPFDGSTIRPNINEFGVIDSPAYFQYLNWGDSNYTGDGKEDAQFNENDLMIYMVNPTAENGRIGYGYSPVESIAFTIITSLQAAIMNGSYFNENKLPPFMASLPNVPAEDLRNLKNAFETAMNNGNWPTVWVNSSDITIKPLRPTNAEMQFYELSLWLARIIISAFELSPQDFGLTMDINKATSEAQERMEQGAHNVADCIANRINQDVIADMATRDPKFADLEFAFDTINKVDELAQAQVDLVHYQIHTMTPNEMRERDGLDPIEGGDTFAQAPQLSMGESDKPPTAGSTTGLGTTKSIRDRWNYLLK